MKFEVFLEKAKAHFKAGKHKIAKGYFLAGDFCCPITAGLMEIDPGIDVSAYSPIARTADLCDCARCDVWNFVYGFDFKLEPNGYFGKQGASFAEWAEKEGLMLDGRSVGDETKQQGS